MTTLRHNESPISSQHAAAVLPISEELPVEDLARQLQMAKERFQRMPLEKQQKLITQASILNELAIQFEQGQRLGDHVRATAMQELGIRSPQTVYNLAGRCSIYRRLFPNELLAYSLVKLSGRPKAQLFTPEQELLIVGAYLFGDWEVVLPNGAIKQSRERINAEFICKMLAPLYPELRVTPTQVARFLKEQREQNQVLFALGREGMREIWKEFVPKLPTSFNAPHECWGSDARILPVVVNMRKGKRSWKCTVSFVVIIDYFSLRILQWCLVPRQIEDEVDPDKLRGADFTNAHVRLLLAAAMAELGVRPHLWYTDRGAQYMAIKRFLGWLTDGLPDEQPIVPIPGFPGHPWSRGAIEVIQKLVNQVLKKLSGFVKNEDDRQEWKRATKATDISFEDLEAAVKAHVEDWNTRSDDGKPSRLALSEYPSPQRLPAPPEDRLVHLANAEQWGEVTVKDTGMEIRGGTYKLRKLQTRDDYNRYMNAVGKKIRYCILPRSAGHLVLVSLDGATWEEAIPSKSQPLSTKRHAGNQWEAVNHNQRQLRDIHQRFQQLCETRYGGMPKLGLVGDTPIFSDVQSQAEPTQEAPQDESPVVKETATAQRSATKKRKADTSPSARRGVAQTTARTTQASATTTPNVAPQEKLPDQDAPANTIQPTKQPQLNALELARQMRRERNQIDTSE